MLSIKLLMPLPCGDWAAPEDTEEMIEVEAKFEGPRRFAAKIIGDSYYPLLRQDDLAIFEAHTSPAYGLVVVARRNEDHAATVKQLLYDESRGRPVLHSINPASGDVDDASGWAVVGYLVGIVRVESGTEASICNPRGIRP